MVARLCAAGREQGAQLLRLVRVARLAFQSGALPASFTVETGGAGLAMQALLAHLQAMQAAVASHSVVGARLLPFPDPNPNAWHGARRAGAACVCDTTLEEDVSSAIQSHHYLLLLSR